MWWTRTGWAVLKEVDYRREIKIEDSRLALRKCVARPCQQPFSCSFPTITPEVTSLLVLSS